MAQAMSFFNLGNEKDTALYNNLIKESRVNGFWISILNRYFPAPDYFIDAEARIDNTSRVDLVVKRLSWVNFDPIYTPVIVFEGKGTNSHDNPEKIRGQLGKYAGYAATKQGSTVWCIGAKGQEVFFYHYKRGDETDLKPVSVGTKADGTADVKAQRISKDASSYQLGSGFNSIHLILDYIRSGSGPRFYS
ncbi:hypothetical protein RSAG8_11305, partial [Rhizoctonia solani AG-8 WAC10335]